MTPADAWTVADPCGCPICGREACEDHLPPLEPPQAPRSGRARLTAVRAIDVIAAPRPVEIIEGVAWAGCLSVLVSESGTGKTFVLLDASAAISDDVPWHGRTIQHGSVVYASFEGDALGLRLRAIRDVGGRRLDHVYVIRAAEPLSPRVTREGEDRSIGELSLSAALENLAADLAATGRPPINAVIIDTVRASMTGSEDSSEHVSAYLRAARRILRPVPGAAGILAHHAGWQDGESQRKRERGSSAWRGNCDATLYLEAGAYDAEHGEAPLTLRALKVRDAEQPAPLHLIRRRVDLCELDRHGQPVTSCVIAPDRRSRSDRDADAAAAVAVAERATDLRTLRTIRDRPDLATSQDSLRHVLGNRKTAVADSLARLVRLGWTVPGARKQPYQLTDAGRSVLQEQTP